MVDQVKRVRRRSDASVDRATVSLGTEGKLGEEEED